MTDWYERPFHSRAAPGGEPGCDGRWRRGGEFEPFYVPRPRMPQIDEAAYPDLLAFCADAGVTIERLTLDPADVRPHQRVSPLVLARVSAADLAKPILASADAFILDGHHRWAAHARLGSPIPALRLGLAFEAAIAFLFSFPKTYSYEGEGA